MSEPSTRLAFTLTSTSDTFTTAAATTGRRGRLEITARLDDTGAEVLRCRSITVTIPTGSAPGRLTSQPERINAGFRSSRGWWHVSKNTADPQATVFALHPQNPRQEAVFDDSSRVTLILERIPLVAQPETIAIQVTAETADTAERTGASAFTRTTTTLPLTIQEPL